MAYSISSKSVDPNGFECLLSAVSPGAVSPAWGAINENYTRTFGSLKKPISLKAEHQGVLKRLFEVSLQCPNPQKDHNLYEEPSTFLERWKWRLGFDNVVDKQVNEEYETALSLLENSAPASIMHLRNRAYAFWHLDRTVHDYQRAKETVFSSLFSRVILRIIRFVCSAFFYPSSLSLKLPLAQRQEVIQVGEFTCEQEAYKVLALHPFADQRSLVNDGLGGKCFSKAPFSSESYGGTCIYVAKKLEDIANRHPHFQVMLGWESLSDSASPGRGGYGCYIEKCSREFPNSPNAKKYLVCLEPRFPNAIRHKDGCDRLFAQKLTQLIVEIGMQNSGIHAIKTQVIGDNLPVLAAAGFKSSQAESVLRKIQEFRKTHQGLFPSEETSYKSDMAEFEILQYDHLNVHFERNGVLSWKKIIEQGPVLRADSCALPDYFAKPPQFLSAAT